MKQGAFRLSALALGSAAIALLMPVPIASAAVRHDGVADRQCIVRPCTLHIEGRGTGAIATRTAGRVIIATAMAIATPMAGAATVGAA